MPDDRILDSWSSLDIYRCRCGCTTPREVADRLWLLDDALWETKVGLEDELGMFVNIYITSGYRCPKHNRKVGGARNSTHMRGLACDFVVKDLSGKRVAPGKVFKFIDKAQRDGVLEKGGAHAYKSFTHLDIRGRITRW